jgi:hypothetical protein
MVYCYNVSDKYVLRPGFYGRKNGPLKYATNKVDWLIDSYSVLAVVYPTAMPGQRGLADRRRVVANNSSSALLRQYLQTLTSCPQISRFSLQPLSTFAGGPM